MAHDSFRGQQFGGQGLQYHWTHHPAAQAAMGSMSSKAVERFKGYY